MGTETVTLTQVVVSLAALLPLAAAMFAVLRVTLLSLVDKKLEVVVRDIKAATMTRELLDEKFTHLGQQYVVVVEQLTRIDSRLQVLLTRLGKGER